MLAALGTVLAAAGPAWAAPTGFTDTTLSTKDQVLSLDLGGSAAGAVLPSTTGLPTNTDDQKFSPAGVDLGVNDTDLTTCTLVRINTTTGAGALVGSTGVTNCGGSGRPRIAFTPDGRLWLVNNGTQFFQVDPTTGLATAAGTLPTAIDGLVGSCGGDLLATTSDATNGALIRFSPASPSTPTTIGHLGIPTQGANLALTGLDFAADGTLWALRQNVTAGAMESYTINTTSGAATLARANTMAANLSGGLAIAPLSCPPPPAAPTPATVVVSAPRFTG